MCDATNDGANAPCACTGLRFCARCIDSVRAKEALQEAQLEGLSSVDKVFERNRRNVSQSSCSFASLSTRPDGVLCTTCGQTFKTQPSSSVTILRGDCAAHRCLEALTDSPLIGVLIFPHLITEDEESTLISFLDTPQEERGFAGWKSSQSGRRKQDFGPQANFKKRKLKMRGDVPGMPMEFEGLFDRVAHCISAQLRDGGAVEIETPIEEVAADETAPFYYAVSQASAPFEIVESSALEYDPSNASNLDPHIDDVWIWGPRVAGVSLLADCVMTFVSQEGVLVDAFLPRRFGFALTGDARYTWLHGIRHENVFGRRVSITMRELAPRADVDECLVKEIKRLAHSFV